MQFSFKYFIDPKDHKSEEGRIKELFTREGGPVRRFPLPPGDPQGLIFLTPLI